MPCRNFSSSLTEVTRVVPVTEERRDLREDLLVRETLWRRDVRREIGFQKQREDVLPSYSLLSMRAFEHGRFLSCTIRMPILSILILLAFLRLVCSPGWEVP